VVALLVRGLTNRQVAEVLVISERTASTHVTHILNKLGVSTRAQIAAWAVEHGVATTQAGRRAGATASG
jgi:DNA-binding NarL/FixJ family response regulator